MKARAASIEMRMQPVRLQKEGGGQLGGYLNSVKGRTTSFVDSACEFAGNAIENHEVVPSIVGCESIHLYINWWAREDAPFLPYILIMG